MNLLYLANALLHHLLVMRQCQLPIVISKINSVARFYYFSKIFHTQSFSLSACLPFFLPFFRFSFFFFLPSRYLFFPRSPLLLSAFFKNDNKKVIRGVWPFFLFSLNSPRYRPVQAFRFRESEKLQPNKIAHKNH